MNLEILQEMINTRSNIHTFLDESTLVEYISKKGTYGLNWMRIFNSKVELSNAFITRHLEFIEWKWLTRILDESILDIYSHKVVQWNVQLYGPVRTIDFMVKYKKRFQWDLISKNPPAWFTDTHYFIFGQSMNWKVLRTQVKYMNRPFKSDLMDFYNRQSNSLIVDTNN